MFWFQTNLHDLLSTYGYGGVALLLVLESLGFPVPGATVLVAAAVYAGAAQNLDISVVIVAASVGAIVGDNLAYWVGRLAGYPLLARYGRYLRVTESRLRLGRYLFQLYGSKVVFAARFIAFLRVITMYLAGVNHMRWDRFLLFNVSGGAAWAVVFGLGGYLLGKQAHRLTEMISLALIALSVLVLAGAAFYLRGHMAKLLAKAAPEPLDGCGHG